MAQRDSDEGRAIYGKCVEEMKIKTRRYARKQLTWIRNRFLKRRDGDLCPPVFRLDVTSFVHAANTSSADHLKTTWQQIFSDALAISENAIARGTGDDALRMLKLSCGLSPVNGDNNIIKHIDPLVRHQCKICKGNPVFVRESQWQQHIKGSRHTKTQIVLRRSSNPTPDSQPANNDSVQA